jgi:hypothetical protein
MRPSSLGYLADGPHRTAAYACSYMTKHETEGLQRVVADTLADLPAESTVEKQLLKIGTKARAAAVQSPGKA